MYVDNFAEWGGNMANFGRMKMSHMIADSSEELQAMADKLGLARRWIQYPGTAKEHYDVCLSVRKKAIALGAIFMEATEMHRKVWGLKTGPNSPAREDA